MYSIDNSDLPIEIMKLISEEETEWQGGFKINSLDFHEEDLKIKFELKLDTTGESLFWEIQVEDLIDFKFEREFSEDMNIYSDHPLVRKWTKDEVSIYVKQRAKKPHQLAAQLNDEINSRFDYLFSIEDFLNTNYSLLSSCKELNFGLFAKGPKFLMEIIFEQLQIEGCQPYYFGSNKPMKWVIDGWQEAAKNLKVLSIGNSFFVASKFAFKQV